MSSSAAPSSWLYNLLRPERQAMERYMHLLTAGIIQPVHWLLQDRYFRDCCVKKQYKKKLFVKAQKCEYHAHLLPHIVFLATAFLEFKRRFTSAPILELETFCPKGPSQIRSYITVFSLCYNVLDCSHGFWVGSIDALMDSCTSGYVVVIDWVPAGWRVIAVYCMLFLLFLVVSVHLQANPNIHVNIVINP